MAFIYDEENQCFSMESNNLLFSCETPSPLLEAAADRLAQKYESRLPAIAAYVTSNTEFLETYGTYSVEEFLELLAEMTIPWIFLKDNGSGTIAYCDPDYVIEFAFSGDFDAFHDFSIDS